MAVRTRARQILVNNSKCTGCRTCETICSLVNEGECNPAAARLHVTYDPFTAETRVDVGPKCIVCQECVKWCPTEALYAGYTKPGEEKSCG